MNVDNKSKNRPSVKLEASVKGHWRVLSIFGFEGKRDRLGEKGRGRNYLPKKSPSGSTNLKVRILTEQAKVNQSM